jgi:hypothetical protein
MPSLQQNIESITGYYAALAPEYDLDGKENHPGHDIVTAGLNISARRTQS